ncbi:MAG: helicase [Acidobacteria bacterium]|nr:helicase [Acidobacteriota bacterium]
MNGSPLANAVLWGQVFEIAIKRGVLVHLIHRKLLPLDHQNVASWTSHKTAKLYAVVKHELQVVDDNAIAMVERAVSHMLVLGYGLGWTCMREYLTRISDRTRGRFELKALWCPLSMPNLSRDREAEALSAAQAFKEAVGVGSAGTELTARGYPAWSDFTLWLTTPTKHPDNLLVLEFSYNAPAEVPDFAREEDHLQEIGRFARYLDLRGVFSRVCAEVKGERFALAPMLASHLGAFTSRDKPFFKLCQGASYIDKTVNILRGEEKLARPCDTRVIAVTSNGFESLAARFVPELLEQEPRAKLMRQLGDAYRRVIKVPDEEAEARLDDEMRMVFKQIKRALPPEFRKQVGQLERQPGETLDFVFRERIEGFYNPMHRFTAAEALALVNDSKAITEYFGEPAKQALGRVLPSFEKEGAIPLRGLHSAAVVAALRAARNDQLNVLALEGNPGIGKTTAVRRQLMESAGDGYLFLYVSPRVVINKDVTEKFARNDDGNATGIMTVTTNATLIRNAAVGFANMVVQEGGAPRRIDSAAVVDGVDGLRFPETTSTWFLAPDQEERLEHLFGGQRFLKESLNEREDLIRESHLPGVLRTLASGTATLLKAHSTVNRVVLTAAMQGYRETLRGTTINGLTELFDKTKAASRAGMAKRLEFAARIPNIVVMVDEVAGDGAGALFVHDIAKWLDDEFLAPFENVPGGSPFKVTLIVSDASLGNEAVLDSYLNAGARAPDKVLVSKSAGNRPFRLAATHVQVGSQRPLVLHVMTNSFPASCLEAEYLIRLNKLQPELRDDGTPKTVRERIRSQVGGLLLASARQEILKAVQAGASQVIYFAQDKEFLRKLKKALTTRGNLRVSGGEVIVLDEEDGPVLGRREVEILDSSVKATTRKRLVQEKTRDRIKVFLMTSSGARGVSFPKATYIIASVPRFNIESSLMEVAQLIYRGRGEYTDEMTREKRSGDEVPRKLVMLVDDFMAEEELNEDPRSWVRRASDIVTLLLMLRSTIHTRIKGDAGLPGKDIALVPVGYVGSSELLSTMSQALEGFRKEGRVYVHEGNPDELVALVSAALQNAENLFSTFQLTSSSTDPDFATVTSPQDLDDLVYAATQEASPLVSRPSGALVLPENVACVGPFWMEDWSACDKVEAFVFDKYSAAVELAQNELKGQLYTIAKETDYPSKIRDPARDLYRILAREQEEAKREFATLKPLASKATWLAVPLDYPRFWRKANPADGLRMVIREEEDWRLALGRALQSTGTILPVIPRYEDYPYAASVGMPDPARLEQVFDDRYFMASTELNLLNTLLLAQPEVHA